jgi:D-sedoheptulose 7-phosphate isomerase
MKGLTGNGSAPARHLADLVEALDALAYETARLEGWGRTLASVLDQGGRLLTAGNGGSAAHAQHLASELVGRYCDERAPYSAIALASEPSTVTALTNDYGFEAMFARQVAAHGREGDVYIAFSTSGTSPNVVAAAREARVRGLRTWAYTGPFPNPLAAICDDVLAVPAHTTATVQEVHQIALHLLCEAFDDAVSSRTMEVLR